MSFHVGQKVVCVDANDYGVRSPLIVGTIYTVTRVWGDVYPGVQGLLLAEVAPPRGRNGFQHVLFRPLIERKTDISIFTALLNPKNHKQLVDS